MVVCFDFDLHESASAVNDRSTLCPTMSIVGTQRVQPASCLSSVLGKILTCALGNFDLFR